MSDLARDYVGGISKPVPALRGQPAYVNSVNGVDISYGQAALVPATRDGVSLGYDLLCIQPIVKRVATPASATSKNVWTIDMANHPQATVEVEVFASIRKQAGGGSASYLWRRMVSEYLDGTFTDLGSEQTIKPDVDTGTFLAGGAALQYVKVGSNFTVAVLGYGGSSLYWSVRVTPSVIILPNTDPVTP